MVMEEMEKTLAGCGGCRSVSCEGREAMWEKAARESAIRGLGLSTLSAKEKLIVPARFTFGLARE